jgi:hypothetical protein
MIPDVGLVGIENTFIITPQGGMTINGKSKGFVELL